MLHVLQTLYYLNDLISLKSVCKSLNLWSVITKRVLDKFWMLTDGKIPNIQYKDLLSLKWGPLQKWRHEL
jgi:hypothetical protein